MELVIWSDFELAVQETIIETIDTDFDVEASTSLENDLQAGKLFALGEMRGVKENPDIVYALIKRFGFQKLGLEWNKKARFYKNDNGEYVFELPFATSATVPNPSPTYIE